MKPTLFFLLMVLLGNAPILYGQEQGEPPLVSLGTNANAEILESSGLAISSYVESAIWTLNDSGNSNELFLLATDGKLLGRVQLTGSRNIDWEAMSQFKLDGKSQMLVADVGDNLKKRLAYQIYVLPEPDLSDELTGQPNLKPVKKTLTPVKLEFSYEDGPKNCEAIGVDVAGKKIWLVEKVYYTSDQKSPPGIYTLPLSLDAPTQPLVAKRIADFPPRNVTGMAFSPDGKRLIIRNYLNAHLYSRDENESWQDVVAKTKPTTVVLPIQRQGEAVCFSKDSNSIILTSELQRQSIWQVDLKRYLERVQQKPQTPTDKN